MDQTTTQPALARARFKLGDLCYTPGAQSLLQAFRISPFQFLARHVVGDWGAICEEDAWANEQALTAGTRVMSVYVFEAPETTRENSIPAKVWCITEADRSVTTLLLPEEY